MNQNQPINTSTTKRMCTRCVMPESKPEIFLNEKGICNLCIEYEEKKAKEFKPLLESDFIKILKNNKSKGKYDCLVMCSGGKDSISALYYMKERYNLTPLAFTFDNGFETDEALTNVYNAVNKLNVDFLFYKTNYMKDMFTKIIRCSPETILCHPCSIWYMDTAFEIAEKHDIPIIVAGWTKGQSKNINFRGKKNIDSQPEFKAMAKASRNFLRYKLNDMTTYKNFPSSMEEVIKKRKHKKRAKVISPHWFLPYDTDDHIALIKNKLDWKAPVNSYPKGSTNCTLNFLSVYYSIKYYGYTHYHVEASKLIRQGKLLREDAIKQLNINFDENMLQNIAEKLNINFNDYK